MSLLVGQTAIAQVTRSSDVKSASSFVYHGKLVRPDGTVPNGSILVTVKLQSPEPSLCLLWAESQTVSVQNGAFSMELGHTVHRISGTAGGAAIDFKQAFINNSGLVIGSAQCASGNSYTPTSTDDRLLSASFNDNGVIASIDNLPVKSVPFALQAEEIGGYGLANLAKISGAGSAVSYTPNEVQSLKDLLGGDLHWDMKSRKVTNVVDPVAANDAATMGWVLSQISSAGGGTVLSVGFAAPAIFSVSGSPITSSGTISMSLANQAANTVFAGPTTGVAAQPTFRALVADDIPDIDAAKLTAGTLAVGRMPALTGDVTSSAGSVSTTVTKLQGNAISGTTLAAGDAGKVYKWSGTALTAGFFGIADLRNAAGTAYFPQCTTSQTLNYVSVSDTLTCANITIIDKAVTYAKIQDMTSGKLLGRSTAGAGVVEELTIGSGLSLSAGTLTASGAVASVGVTAPVTNTGTASAPVIAMAPATTSVDGYLTSADWNTFNGKAPAVGSTSITTLGTVATGTWNGSTIPVAYGGTGTATGSITAPAGNGLTFTAGSGGNHNVRLTPSGTGYTILDGNVGIGTTSPHYQLSLHQPAGSNPSIALSTPGTGVSDSVNLVMMTKGSGANALNDISTKGWIWYARGDAYTDAPAQANDLGLVYYDGGTPMAAWHVDSLTGNFGVGTSGPLEKMAVEGNISLGTAGNKLVLYRSNSTDSTQDFVRGDSGNTGNISMSARSSINFFIDSDNNSPGQSFSISKNAIPGGGGTELIRVQEDGNVGIGTTSPGYKLDVQGGDINASGSVRAAGVALTSDVRFKKDIVDLDDSLQKILSIRGVSYNWRADEFPEKQFNDRHQVGVIAQEVEKQFPELVDTGKDGFKSVNYPALVAPLINAIREFYSLWVSDAAALKAENAAIKAKNSELEAKNAVVIDYLCQKDPAAPFCH